MIKKILALVGLTLLLIPAFAANAAVLYTSESFSQVSGCGPCSGRVSDKDTLNSETAEGFMLDTVSRVTTVSWIGNTIPDPQNFTIRFYESTGAGAPEDLAFYENLIGTDYSSDPLPPSSQALYSASVDILLDSSQHYFMSVQGDSSDSPSSWAWSTGYDSRSYDQYWKNDIGTGGEWAGSSTAREAAFQLIGTTVPIPASIWLFGSALAGLLVAKKKHKK